MPHPITGAWSRWDWIKHFVDGHTFAPGHVPSPEEMMRHPEAFAKIINDHNDLHVHFYTGHEHEAHGPTKPGRIK